MIEWPSHVAFRASCLWVGPSSLGPGREAAAASLAQRLGGRDDDGEVQGRPARYLPVPSGTPHLRLRAPHSFPDQGRLAVGRIPVGATIFFAAWLVGWTVEDSRSRQLNPRSSAFPLRFSVGCSASDDSDHDGRHDERTPPHEFAGHLATHDGMRETVTND